MGILLTPQQILDIKNVLETVTDQFFVTPVTYHLAGDSLDRYNEDREDQTITDYSLNGLVEFPVSTVGRTQMTGAGGYDDKEVKVSFNFRNLITAGLTTGNETIMNPAKDFMTIEGIKYKVTKVYLDGPIEAENVLTIVEGKKYIKKT